MKCGKRLGVFWMSAFAFIALSFPEKPMKLGLSEFLLLGELPESVRMDEVMLGCRSQKSEHKHLTSQRLKRPGSFSLVSPGAAAARPAPGRRPGSEAWPVTMAEGSAPCACPETTGKSQLKPVTWPRSRGGPGNVILVRRSEEAPGKGIVIDTQFR